MYFKDDIENQKKIIELYKKGLSTRDIEKQVPYSKATVSQFLREKNLTRNYMKFEDKSDAHVLYNLYVKGVPIKEIAKTLEVVEDTVRFNLYRYYDIATSSLYVYLKRFSSEILNDYKNGFNIEYISNKYDMSKSTVIKFFRAKNINLTIEDRKLIGLKTDKVRISKYKIKENYFSEMDCEKAFTLGMFFANSKFYKGKSSIRFIYPRSTVKQLEYISEEMFEGENKPPHCISSGSNNIVIRGKDILNDLVNTYGYPDDLKLDYIYLRSFIEGAFFSSAKIRDRILRFTTTNKVVLKILVYHFVNNLGVDENSINYSSRGIYIENKVEAAKIINDSIFLEDEIHESDLIKHWERYL